MFGTFICCIACHQIDHSTVNTYCNSLSFYSFLLGPWFHQVIRFNIEYKIMHFEEKMPENFTIRELDLFCKWFISSSIT